MMISSYRRLLRKGVHAHLRRSVEGVRPHFDHHVGLVRCEYPEDFDNQLLRDDEIATASFAAALSGRKWPADNDNDWHRGMRDHLARKECKIAREHTYFVH
jgi:hypothetical protein